MIDLCRLCLSDVPEINKLSCDDTSYETKIKLIMPEIDITTTTSFVLCEQCSESLNSAYNFKRKCLEVEGLITDYMKEINAIVINLKHVRDRKYKNDIDLNESVIKVEDICDKDDNSDVSEIKDFVNVDVICDKSNDIFYNEDVHRSNEEDVQQQDEGSGRRLICKICKRGFERKYNLERHEKIHAKTKINKCQICSKLVPDVKAHIESSHVLKYVCDVCGAKFAHSNNFQHHQRTHTGDRPFICETCGKCFIQNWALRKHRMVHIPNSERKFQCEAAGCGKLFPTNQRRHEHMKRHTTEKKYKCMICDKAFIENNDLRRHIVTHTGEKPFECTMCRKTFSQKGSLQTHLKSHRLKLS